MTWSVTDSKFTLAMFKSQYRESSHLGRQEWRVVRTSPLPPNFRDKRQLDFMITQM